jgi:hypothetical protein
MQINIQEALELAGLDEPLYPGKRVVKKCRQSGEYKSHCVVYDWRDPNKIRISVKAGLTGRDLPPEELKKYPVSFQAPTYFDLYIEKPKAAKSKTTAKSKKTKKGAKK